MALPFKYKRKVTIYQDGTTTTDSGAAAPTIATGQTSFPVPVYIDSNSWNDANDTAVGGYLDDFFSHYNGDVTGVAGTGKYVKFYPTETDLNNDTNALDYEVVSWNNATEIAMYWVRRTTGSTSTQIWIGFGEGATGWATTDQDDPTGVWDSNFVSVHHLGEGSGAQALDSTSNNNDSDVVTGTTDIAGIVGRGRDFDGTSDEIEIPDAAGYTTDTATAELWFKTTAALADYLFEKGTGTDGTTREWAVHTNSDGTVMGRLWNSTGSTTYMLATTPAAYNDNVWHYAAVTFQKSATQRLEVFMDGAAVVADTTTSGTVAGDTTGKVTIGNFDGRAGTDFDGSIDEVRFSNVIRSADWLKSTFYSMKTTNYPGDNWMVWGESAGVVPSVSDPTTAAQLDAAVHRPGSINIKAKRNTGGEWVPREIYFCNFTKAEGVGCQSAEIRVKNSGDLPAQMDMLLIYEDLDILWYGRIEDKPEISNTGEVTITAIGYSSALKDNQITKLWSDSTFEHWDTTPPVEHSPENDWELADRDNFHRLFIRLPRDKKVVSTVISGLYYRLCNADAINRDIYSVVIEYELGDDFDSSNWFIKLNSYTKDFDGGVAEYTITGTGPVGKTLKSDVTTASKKAVAFLMQGASTHTATTSLEYFRVSSVRVNGDSDFTGDYTYKEVISDLLTNFTTGLSANVDLVAAGTVNIDTFYVDKMTYIADIISMVSAAEDVSSGFYVLDVDELPQWQAVTTNRSTVNWITFQDEAKLNLSGPSVQEMFNQVAVVFDRPEGGQRTMTWGVSDFSLTDPAPLADANVTRQITISLPTESVSKAKNTARSLLEDSIKQKARGDTVILSDIMNTSHGRISPVSMNPNEIIYFADVDASPQTLVDLSATNILNGRNIFRVTAVSVDAINKQVTATLDIEGDRLDQELGNLI